MLRSQGAAAARRASLLLLLLLLTSCASPASSDRLPPPPEIQAVRGYIHNTWSKLTRSHADLPAAARDPKLPHVGGAASPVYVAADDFERARQELVSTLTAPQLAAIDIRPLPSDASSIREHGLLYLPRPYVVPGGRFNEMYGWDSYFIELGLLEDGELELARDIVENALYEVDHFGKILNANRTYYLQRSQPPFLGRMVLAVFQKTHDVQWLRSTVPAIERYYKFWTTAPHALPGIGLSRYYALGDGPAPEVVFGERDATGLNHYDRVKRFYRTHRVTDYDVTRYYDRAHDTLTPLFYKGDRSMRESGFDPSDRFGPFGVDIINYAPVCLNTLLYRMEVDAAEIARILGDGQGRDRWRKRAEGRQKAIDKYLWDEATGLYLDYNVQTRARRQYPFVTTFYPLWAGAASTHQATLVKRNLVRFEAPGGLLTSTRTTGSQWDAPFGWAPMQMIAVTGLRRYGYRADADRIASKFVTMVADHYERTGTIVEKYDVRQVTRTKDSSTLRFGYTSNEIGFGWTNAAVLDLLAQLEQTVQR